MAYVRYPAHCESNGKVEYIFANAEYAKNNALPLGWCDNEEFDVSGSGDVMRVYQFEQGEYYYEQNHIPHGVDFSRRSGLVDIDIHFFNNTANAGTVKFKISLWHLYHGRVLGALGAADATYTLSITLNADEQYKFDNAYTEDAIDLSSWQANRSIHDGLFYKLERLESADGDTLTGAINVVHQEMWFPHDGTIWNG